MVFRLQLHAFCDALTGFIIGGMLIFGPWAFGCTEPWSIWTFNAAGYCLGILHAFKLFLRTPGELRNHSKADPFSTKRGASFSALNPTSPRSGDARIQAQEKTLIRALAAVSVLIPLYCLVGAVNARATYDPRSGMLDYHECVSWLPHSLDSSATWDVFWRLLSLICWFWAVRDYVVGTSTCLSPGRFHADRVRDESGWDAVPTRLVGLLRVLTISGTALALEGILQRLLHSTKLLFLRTPETCQDPFTQFAAFAYRANAAQYFNLLWPVCLGFVWSSRPPHQRTGRHLAALLCVAVMWLIPFLSGARAAALVGLGTLIALVPAFLVWSSRYSHQNGRARVNFATLALIASLVATGAAWGGKQLWPRWQHWRDDLAAREQLYAPARLMARDYPVFGTGPGGFEHLYGFYRPGPQSEWPAQLHNDWLETRITFGFAGSGLFVFAFLCVVLPWIRAGVLLSQPVALSLWFSVAGCLIQACWDFPLQIYSIASLLVFWLAALSSISPKQLGAGARAWTLL